MSPRVRIATPADADLLTRLGTETFTETFGELYPPADLAAFLAEAYSPSSVQALLGDDTCRTWIAEAGPVPVGYATVGPCKLPHPEVTAGSGELRRIYVSRSQQGTGLGRRLLDEALGWLASAGRSPIWLGVYSENQRAVKIYEARGFRRVGEYEFAVGSTRDREFILRRDG